MGGYVTAVSLACVAAVTGIYRFVNADPLTESIALMDYADRLFSCVEAGKAAWAKCDAAHKKAKEARDSGDYKIASRNNLAAVEYRKQARQILGTAKRLKAEGQKRMESCRKRFGDCDTSAEAVSRAGASAEQTSDVYEEYQAEVVAFTKALGTYEGLVAAMPDLTY